MIKQCKCTQSREILRSLVGDDTDTIKTARMIESMMAFHSMIYELICLAFRNTYRTSVEVTDF